MKKLLKNIVFIGAIIFGIGACHDLEVPIENALTPENFPKDPTQFTLAAGPVYSSFKDEYSVSYWFLQSLSTNEAILPARGGNWLDGGRYKELHYHTWTPDNAFVSGTWTWITSIISSSNRILSLFSTAPESEVKSRGISEMRTMRALCYYLMMDLWGNVPIVTKFGDTTATVTSSRKDVFDFIEKELTESIPYLSKEVGVKTYGIPTRYMAFAILAKMYINAEVYVNTKMYSQALGMCDSVIQSGKYALESDYRAMFKINNGPNIKEFIYAIPYDNVYALRQIFGRYSLHRAMRDKYSLPLAPSGPCSTIPEFYNLFNEASDQRSKIWLAGPQLDYKGAPIVVKTTNKGYDQDYSGPSPTTVYNYSVNLTPDIILRNVTNFDLGNDEKAWAEGYRCNKFYPDSTSKTRDQSNDVPIFRYADILLMKAECIQRGAAPSNSESDLSLINDVRKKRGASLLGGVTLQNLYEERSREFAWECWHRNDMIRFGKFEDSWGFKTDGSTHKRIFPIPSSAFALNPKMTQNPGY